MPKHLYIDIRMSRHSGIGTYIRNVVGRILPRLAEGSFTLLGAEADAKCFDVAAGAWRGFDARIYSIKEQLVPLGFGVRREDVYWTPHYNFPALLRCRHVVTVHDLLHLAMPEFAGGFLKQTYARTFFSRVASKAGRILCVSRATADELIRLTGVPEGKLAVIYNGVDPFWSRPSAAPRPIPAPYFLFVGNVKPHKNLRRLVAAMRLFAANRPEHQLVIVGKRDGFLGGDPEVFRDAESMPGRVTFTGYVDDETLKAYFQNAAALVFPSLYEGFGLPLVEAMACGCPVIASDIPVLREICGDGAAIYCDPYSIEDIRRKMAWVVDQGPAVREELLGRARERVPQFTWERCAEQSLEAIEGELRK